MGASVLLVAALLSPTHGSAQSIAPSSERTSTPVALTMTEVVRRAVAHSVVVAIAQQQRSAAESRVKQARAALLPTVAATAARSAQTRNSAQFGFIMRDAAGQPLLNPTGEVLGPIRALDLRVTVQQRLLDPAAIARLRAARAAATVADAEAGAVASESGTAAALAFVNALRTAAILSALEQDSTMAAELADDAARRHAAGLAIALDVTRAEAQRMNTRALLVSARAECERTSLALKRSIGLSADAPLMLADSLGAFMPPGDGPMGDDRSAMRAAVAGALRQRDDVRSAEAQVTAARRLRGALRAEYLPTMSVVADRGAIGSARSRMLPTYTWGVQLSLPVFDGFSRLHRIGEQEAHVQIAALVRRDITEQVEVEVRDARLASVEARAALDAATDRMSLAVRELDQTLERLKAGLAGNADVILAQVALSQARVQRIERVAAIAAAQIIERQATGEAQTSRD